MPDYTLADGETLKNKLGATTVDELEKREADEVRERLLAVELGYGPKGNFDTEHLKAFHQHLFQDVYEWAGHTRDERVALSDGSTATEPLMRKPEGQPFAVGPQIADRLDSFSAQLREADHLRGLPREEFAERAADAMSELNSIHPFREGNGRTQRVFMEQLAEAAGHTLDFTVVSKERMTQASIAAHENGDPSMMRRMFDEISDPGRSAMLRSSIEQLERLNFDWNDRYVATLTPNHGVDLVMAGIAGGEFMARTEHAVLFGRVEDLPEPRPEHGKAFSYGDAQQQERVSERSSDHPAEGLGAAIDGAAKLADGIADLAGRAIESFADTLGNLLGGGGPAPAKSASEGMPLQTGKAAPEEREISEQQAGDDRTKRRARLLQDYSQEISDEKQRDFEIDKGRERER